MKLVSSYAALFLIIRYELFHLICAFPQTMSMSNLQVPSSLYAFRNQGETPINGTSIDWPEFTLHVLDLVKSSFLEFSANVQSEMKRLVNKTTDGELSGSIITSAKGIENISTKIEDINSQMENFMKSMSTSIEEGSKSIGDSIESEAKSVETGVEYDSKSSEEYVKSDTKSEEEENSFDNGRKLIEKLLASGVQFTENSKERAPKSIHIGDGNLEVSMEQETTNIESAINEVSTILEKYPIFIDKLSTDVFTIVEGMLNEITNLQLQSESFETIKQLLESIKTGENEEFRRSKNALAINVAKSANRISDPKIRSTFNDISYEISQISKADKMTELGTQIKRLGAAFEDSNALLPGISTGHFFKNIGGLVSIIRKNE